MFGARGIYLSCSRPIGSISYFAALLWNIALTPNGVVHNDIKLKMLAVLARQLAWFENPFDVVHAPSVMRPNMMAYIEAAIWMSYIFCSGLVLE